MDSTSEHRIQVGNKTSNTVELAGSITKYMAVSRDWTLAGRIEISGTYDNNDHDHDLSLYDSYLKLLYRRNLIDRLTTIQIGKFSSPYRSISDELASDHSDSFRLDYYDTNHQYGGHQHYGLAISDSNLGDGLYWQIAVRDDHRDRLSLAVGTVQSDWPIDRFVADCSNPTPDSSCEFERKYSRFFTRPLSRFSMGLGLSHGRQAILEVSREPVRMTKLFFGVRAQFKRKFFGATSEPRPAIQGESPNSRQLELTGERFPQEDNLELKNNKIKSMTSAEIEKCEKKEGEVAKCLCDIKRCVKNYVYRPSKGVLPPYVWGPSLSLRFNVETREVSDDRSGCCADSAIYDLELGRRLINHEWIMGVRASDDVDDDLVETKGMTYEPRVGYTRHFNRYTRLQLSLSRISNARNTTKLFAKFEADFGRRAF